ncbi:MAG: NIPSNAP family protein [Chloroflexi bacterium]|nr:NIPSNAP family protein [Chloroflexota bacterium]MDA1271611.1 NIPSNAP family protein [Chloroflexota bacterium]
MDQMRTYTINKGMMDSWLKLFESGIKPAHEAMGIPVVATWVNADRTQFIWVRRFQDGDDVPAKELAFRNSPGFQALGDQPSSHIAKMDVQNMAGAYAA